MLRTLARDFPVPEPPPEATFLDIVSNVTRGRILRDEVDGALASSWGLGLQRSVPSNVLRLRVDRALAARQEVRLASAAESFDLVKYVYRAADGRALAVWVPGSDGRPEAPRPVAQEWLADDGEAGASFGAEEYAACMDRALCAAPDAPLTRHRRLFAQFDRHTNRRFFPLLEAQGLVSSAEATARGLALDLVLPELEARVRSRVTEGRSGLGLTVGERDLAPLVDFLSRVQIDRLRRSLPEGTFGESDLGELEDAFELFANGELRWRLPNLAWAAQPSSGYYFFFAEFAFLACELHAAHAPLWRRMLPCLVRTQEIFARVYAPRGTAPADFDSYRACNFDSGGAFSSAEKRHLREAYRTAPCLDTLATGNARRALPGLGHPPAADPSRADQRPAAGREPASVAKPLDKR